MKKICFISNKYPNPLDPNVLVFLQQFVWSVAEKGYQCTIICPLPVNINPAFLKFPKSKLEFSENGALIRIYYPRYISFGQKMHLGVRLACLTSHNFIKAVDSAIKKMIEQPEILYGHFVSPAGIAAARMGEKLKVPSFMAYGEATLNTIRQLGVKKVTKELGKLNGVVAVSTQNKEMLMSVNAVNEEKIGVFPNGYRKERFYMRNKIESRAVFNLPRDAFIVCFVGSFDHRKGIERMMKAVEELYGVYAVCAGKGSLIPEGEKCLYSRSVKTRIYLFFTAHRIYSSCQR